MMPWEDVLVQLIDTPPITPDFLDPNLLGLIRGRYAEDTLKIIGFYTYASPLTERGLMQAGPKQVSIFDSRVFLRVPLDNPPSS